jgi:hypothetical protein
MESCKKTLDEATKKGDYLPQLQLFIKKEKGGTISTGQHRVKLLGDRIFKGVDFQTQKEIYKVELKLEEDGITKTYSFALHDKNDPKKPHYLVERFANIKVGTEVILEGKKKGIKGYVDVKVVDGQEGTSETPEDDIPIIEEDEEFNECSEIEEDAPDIEEEGQE